MARKLRWFVVLCGVVFAFIYSYRQVYEIPAKLSQAKSLPEGVPLEVKIDLEPRISTSTYRAQVVWMTNQGKVYLFIYQQKNEGYFFNQLLDKNGDTIILGSRRSHAN